MEIQYLTGTALVVRWATISTSPPVGSAGTLVELGRTQSCDGLS